MEKEGEGNSRKEDRRSPEEKREREPKLGFTTGESVTRGKMVGPRMTNVGTKEGGFKREESRSNKRSKRKGRPPCREIKLPEGRGKPRYFGRETHGGQVSFW